MPKTLGEIAVEAGLISRPGAAQAGRMAEERREPLVAVLVRELGVDELALVRELRKQSRVPLLDPQGVSAEPEALRLLARDVCARLHVLPLSVTSDAGGKLLRLAMADPTDTAATAEVEQLVHCDVDLCMLPLSAIDELVERGYKQISTMVVNRPADSGSMFVTSRGTLPTETESEVSVTAQMPVATLQPPDDVDARLAALVQVLVGKGLITEAELAEALRKGRG